ncbi:tetratricopeptide repeat protein [Qipengyuania sp. SM2507]
MIESADPSRAAVLAPGNGVILAASAQQEFKIAPTGAEESNPARLARLALRHDPTAVDALTVLGLQAQLRGETERAREIFQYSLRLSRRELRPQIWAIEEAVNRGDIAAALRSYDIALRTSREAPNLLFPNLVAALTEPKVRAGLLPIMASDPVWAESFLQRIATSGIAPTAGVAFFLEGEAVALPVTDDLRASLVNGLLAEGETQQAWAYYSEFRRDTVRNRSRDPDFALASDIRAAFDWMPSTQSGTSAAILQEGEGGILDFSLPPGTGGTLVQQTQLLPPGVYRISGRSRGVDQPERSRPYWALLCQDGRELGRVEVPNSDVSNGVFEGRVSVPNGCAVQTLALIGRATDDIAGVSGQIERASLIPAGAVR